MKDQFKEIITKVDPNQELFTDSVIDQVIELFQKTINESNEPSDSNVLIEKINTLKADHEAEIKMLKEAHEARLGRIDSKHIGMLKEAVNKVREDLLAEHQANLEEANNKHAAMLEEIVNEIDEVNTLQMEHAVTVIDEDRTSKLKAVMEKYENEKDDALVESVNTYLNAYMEKSIPKSKLIKEARLTQLEDLFSQLKELCVVNDEFIQTEAKEAMTEAKEEIQNKEEEIDSLMLENASLKNQIQKHEAQKLLAEKTQDLSNPCKSYVNKMFEGMTNFEDVEKHIDEAIEAYDKDYKSRRQELIEEAKKSEPEIKVSVPKVEAPNLETLEEETNSEDLFMESIAGKVNKSLVTR